MLQNQGRPAGNRNSGKRINLGFPRGRSQLPGGGPQFQAGQPRFQTKRSRFQARWSWFPAGKMIAKTCDIKMSKLGRFCFGISLY